MKFTQKIDPLTVSNFNFTVDDQPCTLYFVPDHTAYPTAIPTYLGKNLVLNDNSFVRVTANYTVTLEVLEITPLTETGRRIIEGKVTPGENLATGPIPVVLLSGAGVPIALTYADANGSYAFTNLPDGNYNMTLSLGPDQPQMPGQAAVDLTNYSAEVNFDLTGATPAWEVKPKQIITFNALVTRKYGDAAFELSADADSGLATTFASSNQNVAVIDGNRVTITGAGTTGITAYQTGNAAFPAATPVTQTLTVDKASQSITFATPLEKLSTDGPFELAATSSSALAVTYVSGDASIASITGNVVTIHKSGTVLITAGQAGNKNYNAAAAVSRELKINLVTGIDETLPVLQAYPNPSRGLVNIPYDVKEVSVTDALGRTERITLQDHYLDLSQHQAGLYIVQVKVGNTARVLKISKE